MLRFGEGDYGDGEVGKVGDQRRVRSDVGQQHGSKGRKRGSGVLENNKHPAEQKYSLLTAVYETSQTRNSLSTMCRATARLSERLIKAERASCAMG